MAWMDGIIVTYSKMMVSAKYATVSQAIIIKLKPEIFQECTVYCFVSKKDSVSIKAMLFKASP